MIDVGEADATVPEEVVTAYLAGRCHVMAVALHERFGLPIGCCWDPDGGPSQGRMGLVHAYGIVDDDHVLDVRGVRTFAEMVAEWGHDPDDLVFDRDLTVAQARRLGTTRRGWVERAGDDFARLWPDCRAVDEPSP